MFGDSLYNAHVLIAAESDKKKLQEQIDYYYEQAKLNGEMAESARIAEFEGTEWFDASEEDYEYEAQQAIELEAIYKKVLSIKLQLESIGRELIPSTLHIVNSQFYMGGTTHNNGTKTGLFIYHYGQFIFNMTSSDYHSLRRYMENHADTF